MKANAKVKVKRKPLKRRIIDNWQLYAMLLVPVVLTVIYKYIPMYGIQIAFRDYKASRGMFGSEWVGLDWFKRFFSSPNCVRMNAKYSYSTAVGLFNTAVNIVLLIVVNKIAGKISEETSFV